MNKKVKKQSYFNKCWHEFLTWYKPQWEKAWEDLKDAIIMLLSAIKTWFLFVVTTFGVGVWKLVVKPIFGRMWNKLIAWIKRI